MPPDDDWMGAIEPWGAPLQAPAPRAAGNARKTVVVVCCPRCSSTTVGKRDWVAGEVIAYWQCRDCSERWREPIATGSAKHRAILP